MIIPFFLLAFFGLGHSLDEPPTRLEIETSINRTIDEVERMISEDSSLPRLTRSQIVDILFNITSKNESAYDNVNNTLDKARAEYQRALMIVLPFDTKNSKGTLKDLYTKPPIVQMILDDSTTDRLETVFEDEMREGLVYPNEPKEVSYSVEESLDNAIGARFEGSSQLDAEENEDWRKFYDDHEKTHSYSEKEIHEPVFENDQKPESSPEKFSFNLENLETTGDASVVTRYPIFERTFENISDSVADSSKLEIVYSTRVTEVPMTKTTTEIPRDAETSSISTVSAKTTQHVLTSDQWRYNAPPVATTEKPRKISSTYRDDSEKSLFATTTSTEGNLSAIWKSEAPIKIPGANEEASESKEIHVATTERPSPVYVTSMSPMTLAKTKYSSTYTLASGGFLTATTTAVPMREELKDLLASLGLRSSSDDNTKNQQSFVKPSHEISDSNNVIYSQASGLLASDVGSPSILSQNTFENSQSAFGKGVENLTPSVQLLFQRFGLHTSSKQLQEITTTPTTTTTRKSGPVVVNLNSYTNFKPLPTTKAVEDKDMRDLLAKFGLGASDSRSQKAMKTRKKSTREQPPSLTEAVPDNMKKILENIGLISRSHKSIEIASKTEQSLEPSVPSKLHVFKPHEASAHTEEQKEKINKLLDTVRMVQEGSANAQDVQRVADDLLESSKSLQSGPDPLSLEEILKIYNEDVRNEVKRQESESPGKEDPSLVSTAATEASSTTTESITTNSSRTMETPSTSETSNLAALAESFGGSTQSPDPVLPTRRRSGLYFLVDWNTFLEVGEEGKDKINLRFQPKVGDRTRFIPVTVP